MKLLLIGILIGTSLLGCSKGEESSGLVPTQSGGKPQTAAPISAAGGGDPVKFKQQDTAATQ